MQIPTAHQTNAFWDLYSRYYDSVYHMMPYRKVLWDAYRALDLQPGMKVLDAGCGSGNFEHFVAQKDPPPVTIEALDFSPGMLATAAEKCRDLGFVEFAAGDLDERLPYDGETFDRIVSINVLYALRDWRATMLELLRVLKPGGRIVVTSSRPDFRYGPVMADHLRRVRNIWGFSRRMGCLFDTAAITVTSGVGAGLLNVFVIDRRERRGLYRSVDDDELREFFEGDGVAGVVQGYDLRPAMAEQNVMASVTKRFAEPTN